MKLKKYDASLQHVGRLGKPTINIGVHGAFLVSKSLREMMKVKPGNGISIFVDQDNKKDWYIARDDKEGFKTRESVGGGLLFNSSYTSNALRAILSVDGSVSLLVSSTPVNNNGVLVWPIITSSARK